ncbi:DUF2062 domain-containing protein [Shewanella sp. D64]|uniref:DUF2062 domain-containing protein n=1 Tax=unclassified Shewanella TaxID=196818 RepID=UPI0022BA1A3C|nr:MULTISPECIES: DUF2062 domain-containing protein [unclassified Shewanella]MEC4725692.1 DUF2062 domain-containing protein [Shewanella sp. D64]MEC4737701.1 DUF2062 domain-containing protein [Shewanella sp. E94]WBJ93508.1 DUF2062 domain-containing protein [Shewanella sp. MTB7]
MPKKFIERFMPKPETLQNHKHLQMFGKLLHKPNLWSLNRRSAPAAFAIGLFVAWIPMPFQMVLAAALAIIFNCNLPVSVALVWITNPITMPFMFYAAYMLGAKILNHPPQNFAFEATWAWIEASISTIGPPFLLGCLVMGAISSVVGFFLIKTLWKYSILMKWGKRKS